MADFDRRERIRGLAQRSDVLHVGIQLALRNEGADDIEHAARPVAFDQVSAQFAYGRIAGADQLAAVGDQARHGPQTVAAGQIEDGIDAVGEDLSDPLVHPVAVRHQGGAEGFHQGALVFTCRPDDVDAKVPGDLRGRDAHSAADAVDQERLAFLEIQLRDSVVRSGRRDGQGCRVAERDLGWLMRGCGRRRRV